MEALGTTMHIAVYRPTTPLLLADGQLCRAFWIGHVQGGFPTGRREAGELLAICGESGIEFPGGAEAAHGHICGSTDGSLSPNGNLPGVLIARALGYRPRVTPVPGPTEYARLRPDGRSVYYRGKQRAG